VAWVTLNCTEVTYKVIEATLSPCPSAVFRPNAVSVSTCRVWRVQTGLALVGTSPSHQLEQHPKCNLRQHAAPALLGGLPEALLLLALVVLPPLSLDQSFTKSPLTLEGLTALSH
jgi:hypothetical protein